MRKNKNILKKGMILAAVSTMVVTMAPAIPAYAYGEADSKTGQAAFNAATTGTPKVSIVRKSPLSFSTILKNSVACSGCT